MNYHAASRIRARSWPCRHVACISTSGQYSGVPLHKLGVLLGLVGLLSITDERFARLAIAALAACGALCAFTPAR